VRLVSPASALVCFRTGMFGPVSFHRENDIGKLTGMKLAYLWDFGDSLRIILNLNESKLGALLLNWLKCPILN
jgi:hypothetical protein